MGEPGGLRFNLMLSEIEKDKSRIPSPWHNPLAVV